jgi:hypothetical protein
VPAAVNGGQQDDTDCGTFTVNEQGTRASLNSSSVDSSATCWK